ncbi:Flp pilus assembly protein CpaB [Aestuariimicrobium kwangyangense]|uniref:Flp pilus assembly protein CpaB n=1 Tax=Aestuariimicrobium kwangyangense TaxID=396389 RepID=UPI0003B359A9|nr:RcpC/CpaB family pilus assembly protein [Aestuariimicrobium kwangyangense]
MKRRVLAAIVASVLALAGVVMIALYVQQSDRRAMRTLEPTSVLIVTQEIAKGTPARLGKNIEARTLPRSAVAPGVVTDLGTLQGLVADTDLHPGEQVFIDRFTKPEALTNDDVVVPEKLVQVTVKLDPERLLGGQLKAGDTVGVDISWVDTKSVHYTYPLLHKILVTKVISTAPKEDGASAAPVPQYVTLAVANTEADRLVWASEHGTIYLTLEREKSKTDDGSLVVWGDPNVLPGDVPTGSSSSSPTPKAGS